MSEPEHIKEIHKIRRQISAEYDHDVKKYVEHLKEAQKRHKNLVRELPLRK